MTDFIRIDSRVIGFGDEPIRILGLCVKETGELLIQKLDTFSTLPVLPELRDNTVVVTDAPEIVEDWQLSFDAKEHLEQAITIYQMRVRANLLEIEKSLSRFNPSHILQIRKIDKNGMQQEFDSTSLNNGHVAVLLAVWASSQIAINYSALEPKANPKIDDTLLPFTLG